MLYCKRKKYTIYIYNDNKLLGYMSPAYSKTENWIIHCNSNKVYCNFIKITKSLDELFFQAFNFNIDNVPHLKNKIKKAWEIREAGIMADLLDPNSDAEKFLIEGD